MRNMKTPKSLSIAFLFASFMLGSHSSGLAADGGGVSGIVRDASGAPLAGVVVSLLQGRINAKVIQTVTTDGTGRFEMKGILPGLYSLRASLSSYLPSLKGGIDIVAGKIADLTLILENLYLQSILGASSKEGDAAIREDIDSVLRTASSTRPILRVFDSGSRDSDEFESSTHSRSAVRGVVGFSTTAYSTAPDLAATGSSFTEFALIKDLNTATTWVVAGVVSDSGFAELDSLVRFRSSDRHNSSVRLSLGILPYLNLPLSPLMEQNLDRLNMYSLDFQDELRLSDSVSVLYGTELQLTDPSSSAPRFRPRWGVKFRPRAGHGFAFRRTASLPQLQRNLDVGAGESIPLTSPFQHEFGNRLNLGQNRVTHTEASTDQSLAGMRFTVGAYTDDFASTAYASNSYAAEVPFRRSRGFRTSLQKPLGSLMEGTLGYTFGSGIQANEPFSELTQRNFHVVAARLNSEIHTTGTQVAATYRWISGTSITIIDPYQEAFDSASPGISLMFIQAIPYLGRFIPGKLEAQVDVRNLLAKANSELYQSANLRRVEFLQPARSVRGGIKLKF